MVGDPPRLPWSDAIGYLADAEPVYARADRLESDEELKLLADNLALAIYHSLFSHFPMTYRNLISRIIFDFLRPRMSRG